MRENTIVVDGLTFPEGPRWYKDKLYFTDFFTHQVYVTDPLGDCTSILKVPNQPSGLGWLPDGTLLVVSMIDQKVLAYKDNACLLYTSPSPRDATLSRMPSSA